MFFKIIGILVVGFFVFVFLLGFLGQFWLRRKIGTILKEAQQANPDTQGSRNPFEVEQRVLVSLIKRNAYEPSEAATDLIDELGKNSFELLNWYEIPELQDTHIMGAYKDGLFSVIYDSPAKPHYELLAETINEQLLVVSSEAQDTGAIKDSGVYKKYLSAGTAISDALSFLKTNAVDPFKSYSKAEFEKVFLKSHDVGD